MPHLLYLHDIIFNLKKYHLFFTIVLLHTPVKITDIMYAYSFNQDYMLTISAQGPIIDVRF